MPRRSRADEAGGLDHALNRGNLRAEIFHKDEDMDWVGGTHTMRYHAHYHTSGPGHVCPQRYKSLPIQEDEQSRAGAWRWGSLWRWHQSPEPEPKLLSRWPIPRLPNWVDRVNTRLSDADLVAVRQGARRGRPLADEGWVESIVRRLGVESTRRPRGRQAVRPVPQSQTKEA